MKRKEILYNAVSGISEDLAADALEYENPKKKNTVLRNILYGAGIAAIFCSFIVLSFVLLKISGPKTVPDDSNAAAGSELITEAETEKETKEEVKAETEATETKKSGSGAFVENPVQQMTFDEFTQMEPYKNFIPTKIPDGFVDFHSDRWVAGEYLCDDGKYKKVKERGNICLNDSTVNSGYDYVQFCIIVSELDENIPVTEKVSVSDVHCGIFHESRNDDPLRPGMNYSMEIYTEDGWRVTYIYKIYPNNLKTFSAKELFDLATTAPYFKDHQIVTDEVKEPNKVVESADYDGVTLSVEFGADNYDFTSYMDVTAALKNNTDHDITVIVPVTADKETHQEIQVSVFKTDNENIRLKDLDTYGIYFEIAESYMTLKPGEEYVQKMRLTGDVDLFNKTEQKTFDQFGVYTCRASFAMRDADGNASTHTLEFEIAFE